MKWRKMGRIFVPDGSMWWAKRYAFPPVPYFLNPEVLRIYLAFCDEHTVGRIGYVDVSADNPSQILAISQQPVLDIGAPGTFDENGILPTSLVPVGNKLYLYYVGYQLGMKLRYYQFEGLAISTDGGASFTRAQRTPVTDRTDQELFNRTSAFVRKRDDIFQMWYVGGSDWTVVDGKSLPVYDIRYMESEDGIHWPDAGRVSVTYESDDEHAFGKPFIFEQADRKLMFYSVRSRSKGYRIGYAESQDGENWTRRDADVGIDVSSSGWDSEMLAYACVVEHNDSVYLFYNGNNCGETGFGYAVLEHW